MNIFEIITGALLLIASVFIIVVVLMQEHKSNLSSVTGSVAQQDSYYGKNKGRTKEAKLAFMTKVAAIVIFVLTLAINLFGIIFK